MKVLLSQSLTFSCPEKLVVVTTKPRIAVVKMGELLSGIGKPSIRHERRHRGPSNLLKTENFPCYNLCEDTWLHFNISGESNNAWADSQNVTNFSDTPMHSHAVRTSYVKL
jgi:hypothetical protein